MNFGETLAYWYFRLNGFFPLPNFVLHQPECEARFDRDVERDMPLPRRTPRQNADADLLALRLPGVFERIGGSPWDLDARFERWGLRPLERAICVLCEVKAGGYRKSDVNRAFRLSRLEYSVGRFGSIDPARIADVAQELLNQAVVGRENVVFVKMLIDIERYRPGERAEAGLPLSPCIRLTLDEACAFIEQRMRQYREKHATRLFFPADLIQFLAWRSGIEVADDANDADAEGVG